MKSNITLKSFAKKARRKPFDWNAFLEKAIKGDILSKERLLAERLSCSWVTCACGRQCDIIPRYKTDSLYHAEGEPMDRQLSDLGIVFNNLIMDRDYKDAKTILGFIEKRSAKLVKEILKEKARRNRN